MVWADAGAFSPDGKTVAVVGVSPDVHLYDVATGREWAVLKSARTAYECVTFSPDGRTLVTGCGNGPLKLWDVPKKK
jgi:WD40 repeat protein